MITLVILVTQIRQNTKAVQAASFDSAISGLNIIRQSALEDPKLTELWSKGMGAPDELNNVERDRFRFMVANMLWSQWNVYFQAELAELSNIWEPQKVQLKRVLSYPGGKWFLEEYGEELESEFQEEIKRILNANDT